MKTVSMDGHKSKVNTSFWLTEKVSPYLFLLPAVVVLVFVSAYPLLYSIGLSFTDTQLTRPDSGVGFIGLDNYLKLFKDSAFLNSIRVNLIYALGVVIVEVSLGLFIAYLMSQERPGIRVIRATLLIPMMLTPVVVGLLWRMLFNYRYGLINFFLNLFGLPVQNWLSDPTYALLAVAIVDIWQWTPAQALVLLAGIKSLPQEPVRAAQVDGAKSSQIFRLITLPMLMPVLTTVVLIRIIESFKVFDHIWMLTQGGPGYSTELITIFIYRQGMKFFKLGYASAAAWLLMIFLLFISSYLIPRIRANQ